MKRFDRSSFLLTLLFVVAASLIFFLMGLTYKQLQKMSANSERFTHTYEVTLTLRNLYADMKDAETERRNYILTGEPEAKEQLETGFQKISRKNAELKQLISDNPAQLANQKELDTLISHFATIIARSGSAASREIPAENVKKELLQGRNVMKSFHDRVQVMVDTESKLMKERRELYEFSQKSVPFYLYVISVFALCVIGFAFFRIFADVKQQKKTNESLQLELHKTQLAEEVGQYGIWILNDATGELSFSDNEFRLLGYAPQSFQPTFDKFLQQIHPEDRTAAGENIHKLIYGDAESVTVRIVTPHNVLKHLQITAQRLKITNGDDIVLGITKDVTSDIESQLKLESINWRLREQNRSLSISKETYSEAEKIGSFGTWQWFCKEDSFLFSDNLLRLFGLDPETFSPNSRTFLEAIYPDDLPLVSEQIAVMRSGQNMQQFDFRIKRYDTAEIRHILLTSKLISDDGNGSYVLAISEDITPEKLVKQNIIEKNRSLEAKNKELEAFNYVASHDLQEPLRKIETFISRLRDKDFDNLSGSGRQYVDRMESSAGRMRKLITDLLQYSRTDRVEQPMEQTDLNKALALAKEELSQQISETAAQIHSAHLPLITGVPFQIQQLFYNLIGNSLKYRSSNVPPVITISVSTVKAEMEEGLPNGVTGIFHKIIFQDNGIGFEQEYAEKIFTMFSRLHGKTEYEGTGIGLAICKKIVESHYGYIVAEGESGKGAKFTVYFPALLS